MSTACNITISVVELKSIFKFSLQLYAKWRVDIMQQVLFSPLEVSKFSCTCLSIFNTGIQLHKFAVYKGHSASPKGNFYLYTISFMVQVDLIQSISYIVSNTHPFYVYCIRLNFP